MLHERVSFVLKGIAATFKGISDVAMWVKDLQKDEHNQTGLE